LIDFAKEDYWRSGLIVAWVIMFIYVSMWKHKVKKLFGIRSQWKRMSELYKRMLKLG
jgi:hypothetical protein